MTSGGTRPLLGATVGPLAAAVIDHEVGAALRRWVEELEGLGQPDTARQLRLAADQIRESARQLREASGRGSAELPQGVEQAESESLSSFSTKRADWWTTTVAGNELGVTRRQAWNLAKSGALVSVTVGRRTYIDPVSVLEEKARREGEAP